MWADLPEFRVESKVVGDYSCMGVIIFYGNPAFTKTPRSQMISLYRCTQSALFRGFLQCPCSRGPFLAYTRAAPPSQVSRQRSLGATCLTCNRRTAPTPPQFTLTEGTTLFSTHSGHPCYHAILVPVYISALSNHRLYQFSLLSKVLLCDLQVLEVKLLHLPSLLRSEPSPFRPRSTSYYSTSYLVYIFPLGQHFYLFTRSLAANGYTRPNRTYNRRSLLTHPV